MSRRQSRAHSDDEYVDDSCPSPYRWWDCNVYSFQKEFHGCCLLDACQEYHGDCPPEMRPTTTYISTTLETDSRASPRSITSDERHRETETTTGFVTSTEPVGTTLSRTTGTPDMARPPVETLAVPDWVTEPKNTGAGAIIGGVVGGSAGSIALICIATFFWKRRRHFLKARRNTPILGYHVPFVSSSKEHGDPDLGPAPAPMRVTYGGVAENSASDKPNDEKNIPDTLGAEPKSPYPSEKSTFVASSLIKKFSSIGSRSHSNSPKPDSVGASSHASVSELPGFQPRFLPNFTAELPGTVPLPRHVVSELSGNSPTTMDPPTLPATPTVGMSINLEDFSKRQLQVQGQAPASQQAQGQPQIAELEQDPGRIELPLAPPLTITTPEGIVLTPNLNTSQDSHVMSFMQYRTGAQ